MNHPEWLLHLGWTHPKCQNKLTQVEKAKLASLYYLNDIWGWRDQRRDRHEAFEAELNSILNGDIYQCTRFTDSLMRVLYYTQRGQKHIYDTDTWIKISAILELDEKSYSHRIASLIERFFREPNVESGITMLAKNSLEGASIPFAAAVASARFFLLLRVALIGPAYELARQFTFTHEELCIRPREDAARRKQEYKEHLKTDEIARRVRKRIDERNEMEDKELQEELMRSLKRQREEDEARKDRIRRKDELLRLLKKPKQDNATRADFIDWRPNMYEDDLSLSDN